MLNLVFAGTPEFALPALEHLLASRHKVSLVLTQPDRPAGRGRRLQASPVKQLALTHELAILQPKSLKDPDIWQQLEALKPDLLIVVAYGLLLPQAVLDIPRYGCLNIHASLLPRWRGAAPIQRAILAGDAKTGVTIMQMDAGLDCGDILLQRACPILPTDTSASLHTQLAQMGAQACMQVIDEIAHGHPPMPQPQNHAQATHAAKIHKAEAVLDWQQSAQELVQKIQAFVPWPVAYTHLADETLRVWQAVCLPITSSAPPGTIVALQPAGMDVATGHQVLRLLELQRPGGKRLPIADFYNAHRHQIDIGNTQLT